MLMLMLTLHVGFMGENFLWKRGVDEFFKNWIFTRFYKYVIWWREFDHLSVILNFPFLNLFLYSTTTSIIPNDIEQITIFYTHHINRK